jgi:hypothetical protein
VIGHLGGDREEIENATGEPWSKIVDERHDKKSIAEMSLGIKCQGGKVIINTNNHFEGSAPITATFPEQTPGIV